MHSNICTNILDLCNNHDGVSKCWAAWTPEALRKALSFQHSLGLIYSSNSPIVPAIQTLLTRKETRYKKQYIFLCLLFFLCKYIICICTVYSYHVSHFKYQPRAFWWLASAQTKKSIFPNACRLVTLPPVSTRNDIQLSLEPSLFFGPLMESQDKNYVISLSSLCQSCTSSTLFFLIQSNTSHWHHFWGNRTEKQVTSAML